MSQAAFRHEFKLAINLSDYFEIRQRLRAVACYDAHSNPGGWYKIRSLYFDNIHDKALKEKIDGVNNREKFRIRYYNDDPSFIKLEKKSKINGLCQKTAAIITKEQCSRLLEGDTIWMRESDNGLFVELYAKLQYQQLRPKTIVDYIREPFTYPAGNVRVTLDRQISSGLFSQNLFDCELPTVKPSQNTIILEIKYDSFIPDIINDITQIKNRLPAAFSKYAACRMYG